MLQWTREMFETGHEIILNAVYNVVFWGLLQVQVIINLSLTTETESIAH